MTVLEQNALSRPVRRVHIRMRQQMELLVNVTLDGILTRMQLTANHVTLVEQIEQKQLVMYVLIQDPL